MNRPPLNLSSWDTSLPDTSPTQGTVVETSIFEFGSGSEKISLYIVGQLYSSRPRKDNALLLARTFEAIKKEFTRSVEMNTATTLNMGLARANGLFKDARRTTFSAHTLKVNMAVMAVQGTRAYISRVAHGVVLREQGSIIEQITGRPLYSPDPQHHITFHRITEVQLTAGNIVYLGTPQIYKVGEEVLSAHKSADELEEYVSGVKEELRNLGMIAVRAENVIKAQSEQPAASRALFSLPSLKKRLRKTLLQRNVRPLVFICGGACIILILVFLLLPTEKMQVNTHQEQEAAIENINTLESKAAALIELKNYEEAAQLLEEINKELSMFETSYGVPPPLEDLKSVARYLSSLIPITP